MKFTNQHRYALAKAKVEKLKGFYKHLIIYILVNITIMSIKIIRNMTMGESFEDAFFDASSGLIWMLWGIGLAIHAFSVFGLDRILGKNWEEKRIKRYMEENTNR